MGLRWFLAMLRGAIIIGKALMGLNFSNLADVAERVCVVKVFGERNCGTRAVIRMLRAFDGVSTRIPKPEDMRFQRFRETVNTSFEGLTRELYEDALIDARYAGLPAAYAWKHAAPMVDESYAAHGAHVLFSVRDPYSWIASFFRNPHHARAPLPHMLEAFLQQPWLTMRRDNIAPVLASPMHLWNEKLRAYRSFSKVAPVASSTLRFEDFVLDPVKALACQLAEFNVNSKGLREVENATKLDGRARRARLSYYKRKAWEADITPEAAALINQFVDWDVAEEFGYFRRDPNEFLGGLQRKII